MRQKSRTKSSDTPINSAVPFNGTLPPAEQSALEANGAIITIIP